MMRRAFDRYKEGDKQKKVFANFNFSQKERKSKVQNELDARQRAVEEVLHKAIANLENEEAVFREVQGSLAHELGASHLDLLAINKERKEIYGFDPEG